MSPNLGLELRRSQDLEVTAREADLAIGSIKAHFEDLMALDGEGRESTDKIIVLAVERLRKSLQDDLDVKEVSADEKQHCTERRAIQESILDIVQSFVPQEDGFQDSVSRENAIALHGFLEQIAGTLDPDVSVKLPEDIQKIRDFLNQADSASFRQSISRLSVFFEVYAEL